MVASPLRLDDFLPYRLSIASNLVSEVIADAYRALFALSIPEWRVIAVIAEEEAMTQQQVGRRTRMDKVTVSRATLALEKRGLVARTRHATDRRAQTLALSASGRDLYAAVAPKALDLERRLFAAFAPGELDAFTTMLERIEAAAQAARG
ncbi:MarR family winged helix-turn-helix transcriptional regulator [Sphingomonas sp.]|uniref:MarR family winged helix-turn-helix transcriptional regulator n=1 Tax=Sphingomonas sp. TaxID=28214 RepID=UPI003B3A0640